MSDNKVSRDLVLRIGMLVLGALVTIFGSLITTTLIAMGGFIWNIDNEVGDLGKDFESMAGAINRVEDNVAAVKSAVEKNTEKIGQVETRLTKLEARDANSDHRATAEMNRQSTRISNVESKLDRILQGAAR